MSKYWIQEYNELGDNWIDYVGKDPRTTVAEAIKDVRATSKAFKNRKFRLIVRADTVIL